MELLAKTPKNRTCRPADSPSQQMQQEIHPLQAAPPCRWSRAPNRRRKPSKGSLREGPSGGHARPQLPWRCPNPVRARSGYRCLSGRKLPKGVRRCTRACCTHQLEISYVVRLDELTSAFCDCSVSCQNSRDEPCWPERSKQARETSSNLRHFNLQSRNLGAAIKHPAKPHSLSFDQPTRNAQAPSSQG